MDIGSGNDSDQNTKSVSTYPNCSINDLTCKSCGSALTLLYLNTCDQILSCTNHACYFPLDQPFFDKYIYDSKTDFNMFIQQFQTSNVKHNSMMVDMNMKDTNNVTNDEETGIFGDDFF
jgi:hypothetical protein